MWNKSLFVLFTTCLYLTTGCVSKSENKVDIQQVDCSGFVLTNLFSTEEFTLPSKYKLEDESGKYITTDSLFETPKLVFRFYEANCENCFEQVLNIIQQDEFIKTMPIIGLISYQNKRRYKLLKQRYNILFPVYFIPLDESMYLLSEKIESEGYPYLFWMGSDLKARHIFAPSTEFSDITEKYIRRTKDYINKPDTNAMQFSSKEVDFGTISKNEKKEIVFDFVNVSDSSLVIKDVSTTCGCTAPSWSKFPVQKNMRGNVKVVFSPMGTGYHVKKIFVFHNLSEDPLALTIKGNVVD